MSPPVVSQRILGTHSQVITAVATSTTALAGSSRLARRA